MKKYNYVYEITYSDGRKYIGLRSCNCPIEEDSYMGSPFHLPEELKGTGIKTILSIHETREAAALEEIRLHELYDVRNNALFINQCNATSTKFYCSEEGFKRGALKRTGRTKETHTSVANQAKKMSQYKGKNRTEAQKAAVTGERLKERIRKFNASMAKLEEDPETAARLKEARVRGGKSCKGIPNPKKGHVGNKHPRAFKWWYKLPTGEVVEVDDSVRNYYKHNPDVFPFSSASIMRFLRENHIPNKLKSQGWDFGKVNNKE